MGLITNNGETAYREEVRELVCGVRKTSSQQWSFKFLGVHITDKLKWSTHTDSMVKKEQKLLLQEAEEIWLVTQNPDKLS